MVPRRKDVEREGERRADGSELVGRAWAWGSSRERAMERESDFNS